MKLKLIGMSAFMGLAGCDFLDNVARSCTGPAGDAQMVRENRLENVFTLVHTAPDGTIKKYTLDKLAQYEDDELLVGENGTKALCASGKPDSRWVLKP